MVVDDSAIVRGLIIQMLERCPDIHIVARAANGEAAITELARTEADVIVLDLEMPVMDGMTALPLLLAKQPGVKVVVASTLSKRNARISLEALQQGASDYVPKPETGTLVNAADFERELVGKVLALGRRSGGPTTAPPTAVRRATPTVRPGVIAIGGSTGAPPVLLELIAGLKDAVNQPILITQHMPPTFTALLAEQIERAPMLRSAAAIYGNRLLAVILTGMGVDGAEGCRTVAQSNGRFIVQDEATSAVWGMPGAAAKTGLAEAILPASQISHWIREVAR